MDRKRFSNMIDFQVGVFDPYSDDPRLAVKKLCLCPVTGLLTVAGTAGQVIVAEFSDKATEREIPVQSSIPFFFSFFFFFVHQHLKNSNETPQKFIDGSFEYGEFVGTIKDSLRDFFLFLRIPFGILFNTFWDFWIFLQLLTWWYYISTKLAFTNNQDISDSVVTF